MNKIAVIGVCSDHGASRRGAAMGPAFIRSTDFLTKLDTVDDVELNVVVSDECLHLAGQMLFQTCHIPRTVQKEGTTVYQFLYHVVLTYIGRVVACNEVSLLDQVSGLDGALTET